MLVRVQLRLDAQIRHLDRVLSVSLRNDHVQSQATSSAKSFNAGFHGTKTQPDLDVRHNVCR